MEKETNETVENREQQAYVQDNCKQHISMSLGPFELLAIIAIILFFWRR